MKYLLIILLFLASCRGKVIEQYIIKHDYKFYVITKLSNNSKVVATWCDQIGGELDSVLLMRKYQADSLFQTLKKSK